MKTRLVAIPEDLPEAKAHALLEEAGAIIRSGGLVAFPTETVYGLGGNAFDAGAAKKIYAAKGRPSDNPLIVHIADAADLDRLAREVPETARRLADAFWPGPLTLILKKQPTVPEATTGGLDTVAVRLPSLKTAQGLIRASGGFVAAPSANASGRPSPTSAVHCVEDLDGKVDLIIDGGDAVLGLESTVLDLTVTPPAILRPGFVTREMLEHVLSSPVTAPSLNEVPADTAPKAPGMKYRHYAPAGALTVVTGADEAVTEYIGERLRHARKQKKPSGVICAAEHVSVYDADAVRGYGARGDATSFANALFALLREMDALRIEEIYAEGIPEEGVGGALMNRLVKAAGGNVAEV